MHAAGLILTVVNHLVIIKKRDLLSKRKIDEEEKITITKCYYIFTNYDGDLQTLSKTTTNTINPNNKFLAIYPFEIGYSTSLHRICFLARATSDQYTQANIRVKVEHELEF